MRPAGVEDAEAVARVHFESARTAYQGILPEKELADMTFERRLALWGGLLGGPGKRPCVELASHAAGDGPGEVVAFAWWRPVEIKHAPLKAEIVHIYVLPEHQRRGLGRSLMARCAARMAEARVESCYLWVFEAHKSARRFYEAIGGRLIDRDWETRGEVSVPILAYAWNPLDNLMALPETPSRTAAP